MAHGVATPGVVGWKESPGPQEKPRKLRDRRRSREGISADLGRVCKPVLLDFAFPALLALIPNSAMTVALYAASGMVGSAGSSGG